MTESGVKGAAGLPERPLAGKNVVITRPRSQAANLRRLLTDLGANVLEAPTIRIVEPGDWAPVDSALAGVKDCDWLIFTSANGVDVAADRLDLSSGGGKGVWDIGRARSAVIGSGTADALQDRLGLRPDLVPQRAVAESLAEDLTRRHDIRGKRILLLRADIARSTLPTLLEQAGAVVTDVVAYRTLPVDAMPDEVAAAMRAGAIDWITFTSASTVRSLVEMLGSERDLLGGVRIASIGPITSEAVRASGFEVAAEADPSDIPGLVNALAEAAKG